MRLQFVGGRESEIEVTKDGRKYMYFTAKTNRCKYRMEKATGAVQVSPYWNTEKKMKVIE